MRIYLKNNPAKLHPDPIWNDGELGSKRSPQQEEEEHDKYSDIWHQFLTTKNTGTTVT